MTTWNHVKQYLVDNYSPVVVNKTWLGFVWRSDDGAKQQKVRVIFSDESGVASIRIIAAIGPEHSIGHREALRYNQALTVGALRAR